MIVYIVGCNGFIGKNALKAFCAENIPVKAVSSHPVGDMLNLDLEKPLNFDYEKINTGDVILFTAAISSPDICYKNHDFATMINVIGTGCFIEKCLDKGAMVIFLSSDTVYGESDIAIDENAICEPAGDYALMKREIEERFLDHPAFKVLRLSYVFSSKDKFTRYLGACSSNNSIAEIFHPIFRRVVYLGDLIDLIKLLCVSWNKITHKIINVCGPELLSRVDMANIYQENVRTTLKYEIVEPPEEFFVARPKVINMSDLLFNDILGKRTTWLHDAMRIEFNNNERST